MSRTLEQLTDLQYRALDRLRDPRAQEAAREAADATDFAALRGAHQCLVLTFKRSGEAVPTPVNFGLADDRRLYFRSEPRSAKLRRIRNVPRMRIAPCNLRGRPTGPFTEAVGRILPPADRATAEAVVASNWSPTMMVLERGLDLLPLELAYVEVSPATPEKERPS